MSDYGMFSSDCPLCGSLRRFCRCYRAEALRILAHNLAVAGALCRAFRLGDNHGWTEAQERDDDGYCETWSPNTVGRPAP